MGKDIVKKGKKGKIEISLKRKRIRVQSLKGKRLNYDDV